MLGGVTMRIIGRFPDQRQVGAVVDSLKNIGYDRKDMIISNLGDDQLWNSIDGASEHMIFVKSETDGLGEIETFGSGIKNLKGKEGILVAVETSKHEGSKIREILEQSGAVEILQD